MAAHICCQAALTRLATSCRDATTSPVCATDRGANLATTATNGRAANTIAATPTNRAAAKPRCASASEDVRDLPLRVSDPIPLL